MPCLLHVLKDIIVVEWVLEGTVSMGTAGENKTGEDVGNLNEILSITHITCSPLINYAKILLWEELVLKKKSTGKLACMQYG